MRSSFPLFQSHLDLAHSYWARLIRHKDSVIDATCGNGHDTLKLCELAIKQNLGFVHALDIQKDAIKNASERCEAILEESERDRIKFYCQSHASFPHTIEKKSIRLIVYNLGYLPGGSKELTTFLETTIESLLSAKELIQPGGAISVTCYPGHLEGKKEEEALSHLAASFSPKEWSSCHHRWVNRKDSPSLFLFQRAEQF